TRLQTRKPASDVLIGGPLPLTDTVDILLVTVAHCYKSPYSALVQTSAPALEATEPVHSFGDGCPHCGDGRPGTRCDLQGYSVRRVRFIRAHMEAYRSAYLNPNRAAASHEMARLEREWKTLPPRHSCTCPRLNPRNGVVEYH